MEHYSLERWLLERHQTMIENAEVQSRLDGWQPSERFVRRLAAQLHRLADRLEGRSESHMPSPAFQHPDGYR